LTERVSALRQELEAVEARLRALVGRAPRAAGEETDLKTVLTTNPALRQARRQRALVAGAAGALFVCGGAFGAFLARPSAPRQAAAPNAEATIATPAQTAASAPGSASAPPIVPVPGPAVPPMAGSEVPLPSAPSVAASASAAPTVEERGRARKGYVTILATPAARVTEGERVLGVTPINREPLDPGDHTLVFERREGVKKTIKVAIVSGETRDVRVNMNDYGF
jgi:hypothetical protein